jgi:hypothetical protein
MDITTGHWKVLGFEREREKQTPFVVVMCFVSTLWGTIEMQERGAC